jgi:hypothetical protein
MNYQPEPLDTSGITLDKGLAELIELLARNTHDNWAQIRLEEGWKYGPERNEQKREHPCLVPYEKLPESEKNYDRQTTIEVLKAIQLLGFRIIKL